jgi:hypothetical protein
LICLGVVLLMCLLHGVHLIDVCAQLVHQNPDHSLHIYAALNNSMCPSCLAVTVLLLRSMRTQSIAATELQEKASPRTASQVTVHCRPMHALEAAY